MNEDEEQQHDVNWSDPACFTRPSGAMPNRFEDNQSARPPSVAQAFLMGFCSRIAECREELQQIFEDAMITSDDPAMEHFRLAADQLCAAQGTAQSISAPLMAAERHLEAFKAAVDKSKRKDIEASPGPEAPVEDPVQVLRTLLTTNKIEAMQAHIRVINCNFWNEGIANRYVKRAELLESTFYGNGDEHAVVVLLADDIRVAEKAFAEESRADSCSQLSGAGHVHRDATIRLFKLMKSIQGIRGLQI